MQAVGESVEELRKLFFEKLEQDCADPLDIFHPYDVDRVRLNNSWLERFLNHHEGDVKEAFKMLWDTCEWRKSFKVNEISEQNICVDHLKDGSIFPYGCDRDDKIMLVFKNKLHVKGQKNFDEEKRCLIYWFERLERQTNGDQMTIFFDMTDSGLGNLDMEFSKYLINVMKLYYPSFLNYILIFEMPWVLNAAFKMIKSWLPARAVQKIKFLNKNTIKDYVKPNKMLLNWGGNDDFVYSFEPETRCDRLSFGSSSLKSEETKKKTVHFALNYVSPDNSPISSSTHRDTKMESQSALIKVIHPDMVNFNWNGQEFVGSINVENISDKNVLYKIRTTSPDRFRVRPNSGILQQGVLAKIMVVLQNIYNVHTVCRDKFLIMSMVVDKEDATPQEIAEIWKQSEGTKCEQHRLKCSVVEPPEASQMPSNGSATHFTPLDDLIDKVEQMKNVVYETGACNKKLHKDILYRQNVIVTILIILVICVMLLFVFVVKSSFIGVTNTTAHPSCNEPYEKYQ